MVILGISGGLGNQMFQFALYKKLLKLGKEVKLDLSFYATTQELRRFELDIFGVEYELADSMEVFRYGAGNSRLSRLFGRIAPLGKVYREDLDAGYQPVIYNMDRVYLSGYWQCEKYFWDIREDILNSYRFPEDAGEQNKKLLKEMEEGNSVSVHVRRGDYLEEQNRKVYGDICTLDYYKKAIRYAIQKSGAGKIYLFTNDIPWTMENLYEEGMQIVDCNLGKRDYYDMYLMSRCRINIIANSSFSWWGAWLNQSAGKVVISPERWFKNHEVADAICEDWIRIKG